MDDAADAFLRAGASDACNGEAFNVGGGTPISHRALTTLLVEIAGRGSLAFVDWPAEKKAIDIGSFYSTSAKFACGTGWQPHVELAEWLAKTIAFYRTHLRHYVD